MTRPPARAASRPAIASWMLFEWAVTPFSTLVITFVYAPYFAAHIAATPAEGQTLWGYATSVGAFVIAVLAPALGAIADAAGRRKPWIALFGVLLTIGSLMLWFGAPHDRASIAPVLIAYAVAGVGAQCVIVFVNAMMPSLVPPERLGRLSGTGWAMGYVGGLVTLLFTLAFLATNPNTGKTILGHAPLFGLDPATHEGDRAVGPLAAIWFVVFALPLFFFTPDEPRKMPLRLALRRGLANLAETVTHVPRYRDVAIFLAANMIYADGLVALFAFGGIYAAGTFGWGTIQIGVFGILLTITGIIGSIVGGRLDDRFGSKQVTLGGLALLVLSTIAILSVDRDRIAFVIPVAAPVPGQALFSAPAEKAYLAIGLVIGLVVGPLQAASRTLLVRISPAGRLTQFFGLYALSARVTSFVGPFLVALVTAITASQKAGMAVLIAFFIVGAALLTLVRVPKR